MTQCAVESQYPYPTNLYNITFKKDLVSSVLTLDDNFFVRSRSSLFPGQVSSHVDLNKSLGNFYEAEWRDFWSELVCVCFKYISDVNYTLNFSLILIF